MRYTVQPFLALPLEGRRVGLFLARMAAAVELEAALERLAELKTLLPGLRRKADREHTCKCMGENISKAIKRRTWDVLQARRITAAISDAGLCADTEADLMWALGESTSTEAKGSAAPKSTAAPSSSAAPRSSAAAAPGTSAAAPPSTSAAAARSAEAGSSKGQNWESWIHHCTPTVWDMVKESGSIEPIVNLALQMGLRRPTAFTMQNIALAAMLHHKGMEECERMGADARTKQVHAVGANIRRKAPKLSAPPVWIQELPQHPAETFQRYSATCVTVYGDEEERLPTACPVPADLMELLRSGTKCRRPKVIWGLP